MPIFQQVLIFLGVPILVALTVFAVIYLRHPRSQAQYRPGEPYDFEPVWFIAGNSEVNAPSDSETERQGPKGGSHGQW